MMAKVVVSKGESVALMVATMCCPWENLRYSVTMAAIFRRFVPTQEYACP